MTQLQQGVLTVNLLMPRARVVALPLLALLFGWAALPAPGETPTSTPVANNVVVIDIAKVFEEHPGFKQAMETMKQEVQAFENELRERGKQMEALRERMKQFEPGVQEYKDLESQILKIQADGQIEATQKKKEFLEREAKVYYQVYNEIQAEVRAFAVQHGIGLVLRFSSTPMDAKNRQSILEGVNQPIVYQDKKNITPLIIQQIQQRHASRAPAGNGTPLR
ncbi:MAG TPA: OmpH family outer membrane protein [Pirellulaceae bacterium]